MSNYYFFSYLILIIFLTTFQILVATPIFSISSSQNQNYAKFLELAKEPEVFDWMVNIRRRIHEYPELMYEEFKTSEVIRAELDELEIPYKHPVATTGVIGYIGTGQAPFVALRADIDALPIQELVEWEHKSQIPGQMHACGHDAHVAMLLGAAKILKQYENEIKGTIVLVFQPAEEGGGGAKRILEEGVLKDIEAIFGIHVTPNGPVGIVGTRSGPIMAGSGTFEATINGVGGHAATPQLTIDPLLAASNVILSLQQLVSREADPLDSQVVTVGNLNGNGSFNVIPDSVTLRGTFRAILPESFSRLEQRIEEVITGQAAVSRCNATVDYHKETRPFYPVTVNNDTLHKHFLQVAGDLLGSDNVHIVNPVMPAEDFSFYQQAMPGYFFFLGAQNGTGEPWPTHSPYFTLNENAFPFGSALHVSLATSYIQKLNQEGKKHNKDEI